jgi:tRNA dimethylallyltransferase
MKPMEWLAIAGPTACGKTALALALAERWPVEIISVDSALVYRGLDIGTAKPSAAERAQVPHHLIDIREPHDTYSAAAFVHDARALVEAILARGRLPLLVGGTLLYFKALFDGLDEMPAAQPALRATIEAEAQAQGWPALHRALAAVDPVTAARLAPADSQRIGRALEVYRASGQPISAFQQGRRPRAEGWWIGDRPGRLLALEPSERAWLHERIAQRFDAMLAAGFVQEVQALRARAELQPGLPAMRCVGYRQAWEALDAAPTAAQQDDAWLQHLRERGVAATRQLAKRQLTWLRSMPGREVVACDDPQTMADLPERLQQALARSRA